MSKTPEDKVNPIPERLKIAREQAGLSQGQVARILGIHRPTISEMEAGRRKVTAEELVELARIYDVSISWLSGEESPEDGAHNARVQLAARELAKLSDADLNSLLSLLSTLKLNKDESENDGHASG